MVILSEVFKKFSITDTAAEQLLSSYVELLEVTPEGSPRPKLLEFLQEVLCDNPSEPEAVKEEVVLAPGTEARYQQLLEPLDDVGSLSAIPDDESSGLMAAPPVVVASEGESTIIRLNVPSTHLIDCIEIMKKPDDTELPPPGTTIQGIAHASIGEPPTAAFAAILVSAEGGPFIDAYLQNDEDILCEHTPIRDTEFLESRVRISMQYEDHMYEFEIVPIE